MSGSAEARTAVQVPLAQVAIATVVVAGAASGAVAITAPGVLGPVSLVLCVAVSLVLLLAVSVRARVAAERYEFDVSDVAVVVALAHLPPLGVLTAVLAGNVVGLMLHRRYVIRPVGTPTAGDRLRQLTSLGCRMLGVAAGVSVMQSIEVDTDGGQVMAAALAAGVAAAVSGLAISAAIVWVGGSQLRAKMVATLGPYAAVSAAAVGIGALLAFTATSTGTPAWWLLGATVVLVIGLAVYARADAARLRLRDLLTAASEMQAVNDIDGIRASVLRWARLLTGGAEARLGGTPAGPEELGVELPAGSEGGTAPWHLVVSQRDGVGRSLTAADREVLGGLASIAATALRRAELQHQLAQRATQDPLTGLANRWVVAEAFDRLVASARRDGEILAAVFVDVDRLKLVNDERGHAAGDALLCEVANRITDQARTSDLVARLGGDEFLVLGQVRDVADAEVLAQRFADAFVAPLEAADGLPAGASVGVACWPTAAADLDGLLRAADASMYRHKRATRR